MKNIFSVAVALLMCASAGFAQKKKDVLMTINGEPVYAKEFKRVYKKNLDLVQDDSQKDIDGYLQLFIDYKLKIAEAKAQHLDDKETYQKELAQYRDQLSRNYLYEDQITEELIKEAYDRGKEEIDASHILIPVGLDASPQDTLAAYNKIKSIREKAVAGADFEALAKKYSEEPGVADTGGNLGYFTVFNMVYPFETEAYNTKKGEISKIVRTRFGYHIIKVNDRRARLPKIAVSHIMISDKKGARTFNPEERVKEIAAMIKQGQSFEDLAKEYSDDKNSAINGGALKPFTKGDLRSPEFEDAAYGLKHKGNLSKPVKTSFGWHLIRLDSIYPVETFEAQKPELEKQISRGDRSKVVTHSVNKRIMDKYGYKNGSSYLPFFDTYVTDSVLARKWKMTPIPAKDDKVLFTIGDKEVKYSDFANYIEDRQHTTRPYNKKDLLLATFYEQFEDRELKDYFRKRLELENEDYAGILNEYRDGLLIFDVMDENIWQKAKNDSVGLQNYYEQHKQDYKWKKRVEVDIFSATSKDLAQQVRQLLEKGKTAQEVKENLNSNGSVNVLLTQGTFELGSPELPENLKVEEGVSEIYPGNSNYTVVDIKKILPEGIKPLEEVKGNVISQYQNILEKEWMDSLHSKYKVSLNKKTFKRLKRQLR